MKTVTIAGCLLILGALGQPTLGHVDRNGDIDGGVGGKFYGPAGVYVAFDGTTIGFPDPIGPVDPDFLVAQGRMNCDREVGGDGSGPMLVDEMYVDDTYSGGAMPDGTFDDGGFGGACHTNYADYAFPGYNSPGCQDDGASASNTLPLDAPWIGAACDVVTESGATCDPLPNTGGTTRCTSGNCVSPCTLSCGADGIADGINYGAGNTRVAYPQPIFGLGCDFADKTMMVFVFFGVTVTDGGSVSVNPAIQGDIWQVA